MEGPRSVKEEEFESAVKLADAVFRRNGARRSMKEDYPLLFSTANLQNLRAYIVNGKVVSLIGTFFRDIVVFGHRIPAVRLGAICTDPEYRGKGLATSLLVDTERFALRNGAVVAAISGARGLYGRFGAVKAGIFFKYRLEVGTLATFAATGTRVAAHNDLPSLARAYAEKTVRFERRYDDFDSIFTTSMALDRPAQIFIHNGNSADVFSYIVVIRDAKGILNCVEHAGDVLCIIGMIRSVAETGTEPVIVHTIGADRTMNRLLSQVSAPEVNDFPRTWKILSPEGLVAQLDRYFAERLAECEVVAMHTLIAKDDGPELTRLVFGTAGAPKRGGVFPVPLPDYGLGYL